LWLDGAPRNRQLDASEGVPGLVLEVNDLTKSFGSFTAVDGVTFSVERGEILGLLGPNGAGKTTTTHMVMGLMAPTRGQVRIFGEPLDRNREETLLKMNLASPYVSFPPRLTVFENLMIYALLYGIRKPSMKIAEVLRLFDIEYIKDKMFARLSSGEGTRVGLAKAFINDPLLLLLDEPTAYLDPYAALQVRQTLLRVQREHGTTVLYTSHNMAEVEEVCNRIVFLHRGRLIASGSPIEVSRAILKKDLTKPELQEVYLRLSTGVYE
jgi:ABC-2 type transport system ATP-binding protein